MRFWVYPIVGDLPYITILLVLFRDNIPRSVMGSGLPLCRGKHTCFPFWLEFLNTVALDQKLSQIILMTHQCGVSIPLMDQEMSSEGSGCFPAASICKLGVPLQS